MGIIQITVCLWFCTIQLAPCLSLFVIQLAPDRTPPLLQIELPIGSSTCQSLRSSPYSCSRPCLPRVCRCWKYSVQIAKGAIFLLSTPNLFASPLACVCVWLRRAYVLMALCHFLLNVYETLMPFPHKQPCAGFSCWSAINHYLLLFLWQNPCQNLLLTYLYFIFKGKWRAFVLIVSAP